MNLRNTRLVDTKKSPDLLHRELLEIVKGHHQPLPFGKAFDRLIQDPGDFLALEADMRIIATVVGIVINVILRLVIMFLGELK